jgi:hypothetical protein
MAKICDLPTPPVDELATGVVLYDIKVGGTPVALGATIEDAATPAILTQGTDLDAEYEGKLITAIDALDTKLATMDHDALVDKSVPADDDVFGYFDSEDAFARVSITWATILALITSAISDVAAAIHAASEKLSLADGDELGIADSESSWALKRVLFSTVKATLKAYNDNIYQPLKANLTALGNLASITNLTAVAGLSLAAGKSILWNAAGAAATQNAWIQVDKIADQTKTSSTGGTTLAADNTLVIPLGAGKKYAIRGRVPFSAAGTSHFKFKLLAPATPAVFVGQLSYSSPTIMDTTIFYSTVPAGTGTIINDTSGFITFDLIIQNTNAGNFSFAWAQGTLSASVTKVFAGAYLEYKVIQ